VRTTILKDANGNIITEKDFIGKTIDVKGIVDYYNGSYQIKVFSMKDITIH
jgi:DNA/RNA endonuclease YhcR with UshA esterase domain